MRPRRGGCQTSELTFSCSWRRVADDMELTHIQRRCKFLLYSFIMLCLQGIDYDVDVHFIFQNIYCHLFKVGGCPYIRQIFLSHTFAADVFKNIWMRTRIMNVCVDVNVVHVKVSNLQKFPISNDKLKMELAYLKNRGYK